MNDDMDFDKMIRILGYESQSSCEASKTEPFSHSRIEPEIVIGLEGVKSIFSQLLSNKETAELTRKALEYAKNERSSDTSSCCSQGACFKSVFCGSCPESHKRYKCNTCSSSCDDQNFKINGIQNEQDAMNILDSSSVGGDRMDECKRQTDWHYKERAYDRRADLISMECPPSCSFDCKNKITLALQHTYFSKFWGPRLPEERMDDESFTSKKRLQAMIKVFSKALNSNGSFKFYADEACEVEICESAIAAMLSLKHNGRYSSQWRSARTIVSKSNSDTDLLGEVSSYASISTDGTYIITYLWLSFQHLRIVSFLRLGYERSYGFVCQAKSCLG